MIKIRVGVPSGTGKMCKETIDTLDRLKACTDIDFQISVVSGTFCSRARNMASQPDPKDLAALVKQSLPYDYYLSMDDDMGFDVDNIRRLLALDLDIVGAAYPLRIGRSDILVCGGNNGKDSWCKVWESGLKEVEYVGGGCTLIKKSVLEWMEYPYWTNNVVNENGYADICSEDIGFCINAREAGYKIYCDLNNRVAHIPRV